MVAPMVAPLVAIALALAGCSEGTRVGVGAVLDDAALGAGGAGGADGGAACARLMDDVAGYPLAGLAATDPPEDPPAGLGAWPDGRTAAWGSPPIVLVCGVEEPPDTPPDALCQIVGRVGWYVPTEQIEDQGATAYATALGVRPRLLLVVPPERRPDDVAAAFADLAAPVRADLEQTGDCR